METERATFRLEVVAEGLVNPWSMAKLPDGRLLIVERPGRLRLVEADGTLREAPVEGLPPFVVRGQAGLLDLLLHPDFATNGVLFFSCSGADGEGANGEGALTEIYRARFEGNRVVDATRIFKPDAAQYTPGPLHFGSRLAFGPDGFLYFTIGDRGVMENAQDFGNVKGKIHRIHPDGRVPEDNPFVDQAGVEPTIWSYGHRNAQGLAFQPATGQLWATEHGPKGGDELNLIGKGKNYGWPVISYGVNYDGKLITDKREQEGMEQPVHQWTPSIAVCGIDFYRGNSFPEWEGDLLVTSLAHQKFIRLVLKEDKVWTHEILFAGKGRLRDVYVSDDGEVYVVLDQPGEVLRLVRTDIP